MGKLGFERETIVLVERFQDSEEETICDDIASISRSLTPAVSKLRCACEQPVTLGLAHNLGKLVSKGEIGAGGVTPSRELSINCMACVGCSALAPLAIIGDTVGGGMAPSKAEELIL
jgi:hypothetical protein